MKTIGFISAICAGLILPAFLYLIVSMGVKNFAEARSFAAATPSCPSHVNFHLAPMGDEEDA